MKLEYLAIVSSENSFCKNKEALKNLLQSDADIKITAKKITHKTLEVDYELQEGKNLEKKHRFFHLKLKSAADKDVEEFSNMGRAIRSMLHKASDGNVQTLWDDISFHYAQNSYPAIHEIENLMRKLITKFMLTNVGIGWAKETTPNGIKKSPRTEGAQGSNNYLYEVDFIQLSEFLFNEYSNSDINSFIKKITEIQEQPINLENISEFIPKSNWNRYFEKHVDCDASYLESRWKRLYDLRCKIAHNNSFSKTDRDATIKIATEVKEKLDKAILSLDEILVPEKDREELAESVISHGSATTAALVSKFRELNSSLRQLYRRADPNTSRFRSNLVTNSAIYKYLKQENILDDQDIEALQNLGIFRSKFIHGEETFKDEYLMTRLKEIDDMIEYLAFAEAAIEFGQSDDRVEQLKQTRPDADA